MINKGFGMSNIVGRDDRGEEGLVVLDFEAKVGYGSCRLEVFGGADRKSVV